MTDHRKLDRLLDLRRHEEQRRAVELALARRATIESAVALEKLSAQREELEAVVTGPGGSIGEVKTLRVMIEQVDQGIHNARTLLALAEATVEEKRAAFESAHQGTAALERIVGPRRMQAEAVERMVEQKQDDEAVSNRYWREERAS